MTTLLEYKIEKTKHGVRVVHNGKIVHTSKSSIDAQNWIETLIHSESVEAKYGDVDYADNKNKNKKYPVDTEEHIRAAWDYINVAKNAAEEENVEEIKSNIIKAWKEKIDKSGPPEAKGKDMKENFINATLAQNYVGAELAFKEIMAEKAAQYLETRKQEVALDLALGESVKIISIHKSDCGRHEAKVYKDSDIGEHKVRFFTDGKHHKDADYHTDDKSDAEGTAKAQLKTMK